MPSYTLSFRRSCARLRKSIRLRSQALSPEMSRDTSQDGDMIPSLRLFPAAKPAPGGYLTAPIRAKSMTAGRIQAAHHIFAANLCQNRVLDAASRAVVVDTASPIPYKEGGIPRGSVRASSAEFSA